MERTRRTRVLAAASVALATAVLAGCSSGFGATSIKPYAPSDGVLANSGDLRILNLLVVSTGASGVVSTTIANRGRTADALTGITSPDGTVDFTGNGRIKGKNAIRLAAGTTPAATLTGLTKLPGETITLKLEFRRADPLTVRTLVLPASGSYASLTPPPTAAPE
ncbi:MAG: hypothetical protein ABI807_14465 [Sporichthyaceae bacterium]